MTKTPRIGLTQSEQAYQQLRRMIIDCVLAPGSSVSEPELTARLKKQKAAVRAALLRLTHDRLVTAIPRSGYRVAALTVKDALELTELRLLTEPRAFRLATGRIDPAILERAVERYSAGYSRDDPKSVSSFLHDSRQFKLDIARASGNQRLASWIEEVSEAMDRYIRLSLVTFDWAPIATTHIRKLRKSMLAGRAAEAEGLAAVNIETVSSGIMSALLSAEGGMEHPEFGPRLMKTLIATKFGT